MSKLNKSNKRVNKTVSHEGGEVYKQSAELELMELATTSLLSDTFYTSSEENMNRLKRLSNSVSIEFLTKLAAYTRNEMKLRSMPQVLFALAAQRAAKEGNQNQHKMVRSYAKKVIKRADEPADILNFWIKNIGGGSKKHLPTTLKKSIADSLNQFNAYHLAKYKGGNKELKLRDVLRIVHPKPINEEQSALFKQVMDDSLESPDTWEVHISANGASEKTWNEIAPKMGIFALLRNLRNFETHKASEAINCAIEKFKNKTVVEKSGILPYQWAKAVGEVTSNSLKAAIQTAMEHSIANVPDIEKKTIVVVDHSASMGPKTNTNSVRYKADILAAMIYKKCKNAEVYVFGDSVEKVDLLPNESLLRTMRQISETEAGHSTNISPVFDEIPSDSENVVVLSDMQIHVHYYSDFQKWKKKNNADCRTFSINLCGYGTNIVPETTGDSTNISGWSERIIDFINSVGDATMLDKVKAA